MKYTFSTDSQGKAVAHFDEKHQLIAYWLMSNCSEINDDFTRLLRFAKKLQAFSIDDYQSSQRGYYLQLSQDNAKLTALSTLKNPLESDSQSDGKMDFDNMTECNVPMPEFNVLLEAWHQHLQEIS